MNRFLFVCVLLLLFFFFSASVFEAVYSQILFFFFSPLFDFYSLFPFFF